MTAIQNFTIYGERCSGTNFLEEPITKNFNLPITKDAQYKLGLDARIQTWLQKEVNEDKK